MKKYDIAIVGSGLVGLATAYTFSRRYPDKTIVVIEKEKELASHQSSRNSGVVHSGVYYKPKSLKAENCKLGKKLLHEFCDHHEIPIKLCGKVIVTNNEAELPQLQSLYERGLSHGIECKLIGHSELKEVEPYLAGLKAIHIPSVAVIKFSKVANKLAELISLSGAEIKLSAEVKKITKNDFFTIETSNETIEARFLVNTAGLHCDRIAALSMGHSPVRIIPFRGEYYELSEGASRYCNALIYPVPDPAYPFLGVHVTRMIDGTVECGPNAVLALAREGYDWGKINFKDCLDTFTYAGFLKFGLKNLKTGIFEVYRSLSKKAFLDSIQVLIPDIKESDLRPGNAGVRAQAITPEGKLVDDFYFFEGPNQLHVLNAPSPAATSCLSIGESIVSRLAASFNE